MKRGSRGLVWTFKLEILGGFGGIGGGLVEDSVAAKTSGTGV